MHRGSQILRIAAALAISAGLGGCGDISLDSSQWFRKPLYLTGQTSGYTFSDVQKTRQDRQVTANDLVEANGSCPPSVQAQPAPGNPPGGPAGAPDGASLIDDGVGLGMSECDVVHRAGVPSNVEIGKNPNGDRTVVLTYRGGPRPGIYRFERGLLMEMDRVAEPAPSPATAKKKPAKAANPKTNNAT